MRIVPIITLVGLLSGARADKLGAASTSYLPPAEESASQSEYQYDYGEDEYGEVPTDQQAGYDEDVEAAASEVLDADAMNLKMLMGSVPGTPGEDYPIFATAPDTDFSCSDKIPGGYYADPAAECQAYHVCGAGYALLCPNGTIFNQEKFICDWWFNFDCGEAESFYGKNEEIAAARQAAEGAASDSVGTEDIGEYGDGAADIGEYGDAAAATAPEESYLPPAGRRGRKNGRRGRKNVQAKLKKTQSRRLKKNLQGNLKKKGVANKKIGNKKKGKAVRERARIGKSKTKGAANLRKKNKSNVKKSKKQNKSGRSGRKGKSSHNNKQRKTKANGFRNTKNRKGRRGPIKG